MNDARYVYGVVRADAQVDPEVAGSGLGDGVELVRTDVLAAVVEGIDPSRPIGTRKDLVAHSSVLNAMALSGAVVPLRFGTVLTDEDSVADDLLVPMQQEFTELLAELDHHAQYTLSARYDLDVVLTEVVRERPDVAALREQTSALPEDLGHPDRIRMGELVAQAVQAKRDQDGVVVVDAVSPYAEATVVKEGRGMDGLVEVACLVADESRDAFEEAAETLARDLGDRVRMRMLGPIAPYDFVPGD